MSHPLKILKEALRMHEDNLKVFYVRGICDIKGVKGRLLLSNIEELKEAIKELEKLDK